MRCQYQRKLSQANGPVVTEPAIAVAAIAGQVVDAVRGEHALGPTGEFAVEGLGRLPSPSAAVAKRESEVFFGLAVEGKGGVAGFEGFGRQCGDALELCVAIERFATPPAPCGFCARPAPKLSTNPARRGD